MAPLRVYAPAEARVESSNLPDHFKAHLLELVRGTR